MKKLKNTDRGRRQSSRTTRAILTKRVYTKFKIRFPQNLLFLWNVFRRVQTQESVIRLLGRPALDIKDLVV